MKFKSDTIIKVEFYDLDPMNVVWHGNYVKYLEVARCDMLSRLGYTYIDMKNDGYAYPVATMEMKYIKPCTFGQELKIVSIVEEIEPALVIKYVIFDNKTGEKKSFINPVWVVRKLPPKNLKKLVLINGINEYQKAPPNKILNVNAKMNVINENEIAAVYDLNMVEIDNAKTV